MNEHNTLPSEELNLLALQYLGDDLTDDARAAFETRLLDDQAAREAVASAVELTLAAREAFAEDAVLVAARDEARRPVAKGAWWNVALAGCALAALVTVSQMLQPGNRPATEGEDALAVAWSEARDEWPTSALTDDQEEISDSIVIDGELALPTWMLAAVADTKIEMSETDTGDTIPE